MFFVNLCSLVLGLFALLKGADLLVHLSCGLARRFSVNPFFVGVVLLGMGTSAPEWAVSAVSSLKGMPDLATGNIFGSNVFNILLVLALILLKPLSNKKVQLIKKDILFLFLSGLFLIPIMMDDFISRADAFVLSLIFVIYMVFSVKFAKRAGESAMKAEKPPVTNIKKQNGDEAGLPKNGEPFGLKSVLCIILGFVLLIGGSHLTVAGAVGLGKAFGMSERLIGILIVSVGTSLPELFTSFTAILKGYKDMAVGNIIGSNIFNTFAIFSTVGWILPAKLDPKMTQVDLPVLLLIHTALLSIVFCYRFKWINRLLPYAFFIGYIVYLGLLLKT